MRTIVAALLLGSVLTLPLAAEAQNFQQLLGGLLTGNQQQDQSLRDAWQRGYQAGRRDQARDDHGTADRYDRRSGYQNRQSDYDSPDRGNRSYAPPPDSGFASPPPR
ncbi:MAG: hypothetical protein JOY66_05590 [Acetobacteraceae bacterium]|nr:hypothetical protein [Acetobacteraceae bacterium]